MTLDRAYIGSCTGGKTSDFLAFAHVVKGKTVKIDTFGVPATTKVVQELKDTLWDGESVWSILESAGVRMTENASCAACLGGPVDTFGRMNTPMKCISATNRNFPGRMGHKESQVFLASPYTVAASALTGQHHRSARIRELNAPRAEPVAVPAAADRCHAPSSARSCCLPLPRRRWSLLLAGCATAPVPPAARFVVTAPRRAVLQIRPRAELSAPDFVLPTGHAASRCSTARWASAR